MKLGDSPLYMLSACAAGHRFIPIQRSTPTTPGRLSQYTLEYGFVRKPLKRQNSDVHIVTALAFWARDEGLSRNTDKYTIRTIRFRMHRMPYGTHHEVMIHFLNSAE